MATPPFENIFQDSVGTFQESTPAKFKVRVFSRFGAIRLLAFNAHNLQGHVHVTVNKSPVRKFFRGSCRDFPWEHARQIRSSYL